MIRTFANKPTEQLWLGRRVRAYNGFAAKAEAKLALLDAAKQLVDLSALPGNHFEALKGDRAGQYSIRIDRQWRLCFRWESGDVYGVEIVDYQ